MQQLDSLFLQQKVDEANPDPFRGLFRPIADNVTMFSNVTARLEQGLVAKVVSAPLFVPLRQPGSPWKSS
jgi:hypothetical protein